MKTFEQILEMYGYTHLDHRKIEDFKYIRPKNYNRFKEFFDKYIKQGCVIDIDSDGDGFVCTKLMRQMYLDFDNDDISLSYQAIPHYVNDGTLDYTKVYNKVLVLLDSSSNNVGVIERLHKNKIPAIIIDHHKLSQGIEEVYERCNSVCVISNQDDYEELRDLSCGMYLYILMHYYYLDNGKKADEYFDLATLSLTSDVCPMDKPYHRSIIKKYLKNKDRNYFISSYTDKFQGFSTSLLSMHITPRINALFRTNSNLLVDKLIQEEDLEQLKKHVDKVYKNNKAILKAVLEQLTIYDYGYITYANISEYPVHFLAYKYTGLIANKILEQYRKPCIVTCNMNNGISKGSVRSNIDLDIGKTLSNLPYIKKSGGHTMAHGFTIEEDKIQSLLHTFNNKKIIKQTQTGLAINQLVDILRYKNTITDIANFNEFSGSNVDAIGFIYKVKSYDTINIKDNYTEIINTIKVVAFTQINPNDIIYITPRNSINGIQFIANKR